MRAGSRTTSETNTGSQRCQDLFDMGKREVVDELGAAMLVKRILFRYGLDDLHLFVIAWWPGLG